MDAFLNLFGAVTLSTVIEWCLAIGFIAGAAIAIWKKISAYLTKKLEADEHTREQMQTIMQATAKLPEIEQKLNTLETQQTETIRRLDKIEEDARRRERNTLRDRILQSYRYFTSLEHNPRKEWTKMESDAFDELYNDYVDAGGNGYVHLTQGALYAS